MRTLKIPGVHLAVWTCVIPRFALRLSDSNPDIPTEALRMSNFISGSREDSLASLERLCGQYQEWIDMTEHRIPSLDQGLQDTARRHMDRCRDASVRMRNGIDLLRSDSDAWEAFRLANKAMLMQRARSDWLAGDDHDQRLQRWMVTIAGGLSRSRSSCSAWRESPHRLAMTASSPTCCGSRPVAARPRPTWGCLRSPTLLYDGCATLRQGHGVTVIMRYTLRLLTIQQFERAALLICCLEAIRREDQRLGDEPIEIGLWVGRGATPNTLAEAKVSIDKLAPGGSARARRTRCSCTAVPGATSPIEAARAVDRQVPARLVTPAATRAASSPPACRSASSTRTSTRAIPR